MRSCTKEDFDASDFHRETFQKVQNAICIDNPDQLELQANS